MVYADPPEQLQDSVKLHDIQMSLSPKLTRFQKVMGMMQTWRIWPNCTLIKTLAT
jgi:hypothetical protein